MKKMLKSVGMLIVLSAYFATIASAQGNPEGYGMFTTFVQYTEDINAVKGFFESANFGTLEQSNRVYRENIKDPATGKIYFRRSEIITIVENEMSNQMGETFDPGHPEWYTISYDDVDESFWDEWEDSYLIIGDKKLHWGDPRMFALNRNHPNKRYLIATVTNKTTGAFFKCRANCGNVLKPVHHQVINPAPVYRQEPSSFPNLNTITTVQTQTKVASAGCEIISFTTSPDAINPGETATIIWTTTCATVNIAGIGTNLEGSGSRVVQPMHTFNYILSCRAGNASATVNVLGFNKLVRVKTGFGKALPWIIGGIVVSGGTAYLISHHKPADAGKTYSTEIQQPTGPGGATGGSGVPIKVFHPGDPSNLLIGSLAPKSKITLSYVIHF